MLEDTNSLDGAQLIGCKGVNKTHTNNEPLKDILFEVCVQPHALFFYQVTRLTLLCIYSLSYLSCLDFVVV